MCESQRTMHGGKTRQEDYPTAKNMEEKKDKKTTLHLLHYMFHCTNCTCNRCRVGFLPFFSAIFCSRVVAHAVHLFLALPCCPTFYRSSPTCSSFFAGNGSISTMKGVMQQM